MGEAHFGRSEGETSPLKISFDFDVDFSIDTRNAHNLYLICIFFFSCRSVPSKRRATMWHEVSMERFSLAVPFSWFYKNRNGRT
jgi:hypothetical protein